MTYGSITTTQLGRRNERLDAHTPRGDFVPTIVQSTPGVPSGVRGTPCVSLGSNKVTTNVEITIKTHKLTNTGMRYAAHWGDTLLCISTTPLLKWLAFFCRREYPGRPRSPCGTMAPLIRASHRPWAKRPGLR